MLIEIILGERTPDADAPIQYSVVNEGFRATINGEAVFEPVAPLRRLFAKLKARDNILADVCSALSLVDKGDGFFVAEEVKRLLDERASLVKIARGLGLDGLNVHDLPAQVLAMNTELTAALAKAEEGERAHVAALAKAELAEAEVKALAEENARLRAEVEQERGHKLSAMTAADIAISRATELEAEVRSLKSKLAEADLGRIMAEATAAGMRTALQHLKRALAGKFRT